MKTTEQGLILAGRNLRQLLGCQEGFGLVETLAAMAIGAVVMASFLMLFSQILGFRQNMDAGVEKAFESRQFFSALDKALFEVCIPPWYSPRTLDGMGLVLEADRIHIPGSFCTDGKDFSLEKTGRGLELDCSRGSFVLPGAQAGMVLDLASSKGLGLVRIGWEAKTLIFPLELSR